MGLCWRRERTRKSKSKSKRNLRAYFVCIGFSSHKCCHYGPAIRVLLWPGNEGPKRFFVHCNCYSYFWVSLSMKGAMSRNTMGAPLKPQNAVSEILIHAHIVCSWTTAGSGRGVSCELQSFFRVRLGGLAGGGGGNTVHSYGDLALNIRSCSVFASLHNILHKHFDFSGTRRAVTRVHASGEQAQNTGICRIFNPKPQNFCFSPPHIAQGCLMFLEQDTQSQALMPWRRCPTH